MKSLEYLPHIADVRMKIQGSSEEELFRAGLEGIGRILKADVFEKPQQAIEIIAISLVSVDMTSLLVEFLNEVLMFSHIQKAVFFDLEIQHIGKKEIIAKIFGSRVGAFDEDIKAVTYHEAQVKKNKSGMFETIIVLDI
ncbi:archease [Shivajiella indica]|uniref:Archease n=1 Tax=Shivajiella indica TaxID=872115 RepID=A0ABW5BBD2_9BACT